MFSSLKNCIYKEYICINILAYGWIYRLSLKAECNLKLELTRDVGMIVANCKQYIYSSNPSPLIEHGDDHESNL